nr:MAG TPA: DNA repair protein RAD25 [Caudoviricetes sp.]
MTKQVTLICGVTTGAIYKPDQDVKTAVSAILSYHVTGFEQTYAFKSGTWDGTSTFFKWSTSTFPAGFLAFVAARLKQLGYEVKIVRKPLPGPKGPEHPVIPGYISDERYSYQYDTVDRLVKYGGMVAMLATGCHARGTRVLMFDGSFKAVEDVVVGDVLMGPDSEPRTVQNLCRGRDTMYRITPVSGGKPFVVNGDHILSLKQTNVGVSRGKRAKTNGQWVNISVRDYLKQEKSWKHIHKLHRSTGIDFHQTPDLIIPPYLLGILLGDAYLPDGSRMISLTTPDIELCNYLNDWAKDHFIDLSYGRKEGSKALAVTFACHRYPGFKLHSTRSGVYTNPLKRELSKLGLLGKNSAEKFVPTQYKTASHEDRLEILAGLLDTDGHLSHNGFDYVTKSKQLGEDVAFIARSLGLKVNEAVKTLKSGPYAGNEYVRLNISGNTEIIPTKLARKRAEPRRQIKSPIVTGFSVEEIGIDDYYGFQLDGDHLYLMDDFTITHNSGKSVVNELAFARIRRPTLFITTRQILMYQMKTRFEKDFGIPVGVFGDNEFGVNGDATKMGLFNVAMVQTIAARLKGASKKDTAIIAKQKEAEKKQMLNILEKVEMLVLEEAHESSGNQYFEICNLCKNASYRLALTATPFMKDNEEANMRLMAVSGPIGIHVTEKLLIDRGILAKPYFKIINLHEKPKYLRKATPWQQAYRLAIVENEERNQLIVSEALKAKHHGLSVMCLVLHKDHGRMLKTMMEDVGLKVEFIFGESNQKTRQANLDKLKNGEINVLIGSTILDVGVDVPAVGMVILAGAGKAEVSLRQRIGRGLRAKKQGPNVCFVVDFDDPWSKHTTTHALMRRNVILNTPGFAEGVVSELPWGLFPEK